MRRHRMIAMMTAALAITPLAMPAAAADLPKRLRAMTPADFDRAILIRDDAPAGQTILSTEAGFARNPRSPIRRLLTDNHLRAVIDRDSGAVRYELHQSIFYWGKRRAYVAARLPTTSGTRQAALIRADHGERFCPNEDNWGQCALTKQVAFAIDEAELKAIAARYRSDGGAAWTYRIEERDGHHWDDVVSPAEAAGLLIATARLRG